MHLISSGKTVMYKGWDVVEEMPSGFSEDYTAGSPYPCSVFVTNGKSVLSGKQIRKILIKRRPIGETNIKRYVWAKKTQQKKEVDPGAARAINNLARMKMIKEMLADIAADMMVCDIEGWDKLEYIKLIKSEIGKIGGKK